MKFLADENIEREFVEALRKADFDVLSVRENFIGAADAEILQIAVDEKAVILTYDTDLANWFFASV
jgi:predicted nuclease of predicted toxin-antitoxin system